MDYFVVCLAALVASGLTFFSGFGLGTVLMPALALFLPVPAAVAATAVVHFANNLFKVALVGRSADRQVLLRFALPAMVAALCGAALLTFASLLPVLGRYELLGVTREVTALKLGIGVIIIVFALLETVPRWAAIAVDRKYLPLGGLLSGFFGGLSGNQGALRAMFLLKAGLGKEAYIGTGAVAAALVDVARLTVYGFGFLAAPLADAAEIRGLILAATVAAFAGTLLGRRLLHKVTLRTVQLLVGAMLMLLGSALAAGLV